MHHTDWSTLPAAQIAIFWFALVTAAVIYLLPTIIAIKRNGPQMAAAIIVNLIFGFTVVGWIVALILASKQPQPPVVVIYGGAPPPP